MSLINCEISLQLKWSKDCILVAGTAANQEPKFETTDTKIYVPIVTLSTQDNIQLFKQLESRFKRTINRNKYHYETNQAWNRFLDFFIDASFHGVNRLFVLSFKDKNNWKSYKQYYFATVEIKVYNIMINGINFFDQPMKNDLNTFDNIRKKATGQGDDCTPGCLLDYPCFKNTINWLQ